VGVPHISAMATLSGTVYQSSRKKLNEVLQALCDCGIEQVLPMPKIVVIGNQSAGKSSLIEAISQIKVPRAQGTCTRCPMEVRLRRGDSKDWKCEVSLRYEHCEVTGQILQSNLKFGNTDSKEQVAGLLRRAQLAILNPKKPLADFLNLTEDECNTHAKGIGFSKNTVVLDITGADVDVAFIDLPGLIQNTEKVDLKYCVELIWQEEDAHFIDLIRELTVSYVSQPECLILVTISMKGNGNLNSSDFS
jgi:GTPase SAR1 family protein